MQRKKGPTMDADSHRASSDACRSTQRLARAASSLGHLVEESDGIPIEALADDDSAVAALDVIVGRAPSRRLHS